MEISEKGQEELESPSMLEDLHSIESRLTGLLQSIAAIREQIENLRLKL